MTILAIVAIALTGVLAWRRSRMWRAAERDIASRLPLGTNGIIVGAQPVFYGGSSRAALLLHGFGDTPQSLEPLASRLRDGGWTVLAPLLPGHGRTLTEFSASGAREWRLAARQAYDELARRQMPIAVCGQSMGAALALDLAEDRALDALALLAPYISMPLLPRVVGVLWPLSALVYPVIATRSGESIHDPVAERKSLAFGYSTPRLLLELSRVVRRAQRGLRSVRTATLVIHSREDNRVPPERVARAVARIEHPVKVLHWLTGCGHVVTVDYCRDQVATLVVEWLDRCTASRGAASAIR